MGIDLFTLNLAVAVVVESAQGIVMELVETEGSKSPGLGPGLGAFGGSIVRAAIEGTGG